VDNRRSSLLGWQAASKGSGGQNGVSLLKSYSLSSLPAFDGLSAAGGQLYLATRDRKVICFADAVMMHLPVIFQKALDQSNSLTKEVDRLQGLVLPSLVESA